MDAVIPYFGKLDVSYDKIQFQYTNFCGTNYVNIKTMGSFWENQILTLILLTWNIGRAHNNIRKWQMGFNLAFKG